MSREIAHLRHLDVPWLAAVATHAATRTRNVRPGRDGVVIVARAEELARQRTLKAAA
jgi:hypothetical protein